MRTIAPAAFAALGAAVLLAGCGSTRTSALAPSAFNRRMAAANPAPARRPNPAAPSGKPATPRNAGHEGMLRRGDTIEITVDDEPSLSGEFVIGDAGTIKYPWLGNVPMDSLTPGQAADRLRNELQQGYLVSPRVSVVPARPAGRVTVTGRVKSPGVIPFEPGLTVMEAIIKAGGATEFADLRNVRVTRKTSNGNESLRTNLSGVEKGDPYPDVELWPGDIVVVPKGWRLW